VKYHISKTPGLLHIKISGDTRKNEALPAKKVLSQHLREQGMKVIVDMKELNRVEPMALVGVLNAIRKEVRLLNGDLKLRSIRPEILHYFQVHRLDRIFQFCQDEKEDTDERREDHGKK
jgi:anti-anti-sigma factor